jgi:excinuclease ABC subunit C
VADPATYRPRTSDIPDSPGVYRFRDAQGRVIYVGKAKSLRSRLVSYFADLSALHPRTQTMVTTAAGVEWTVVGTEVEALQLEYSWIKEYDPRFNVKYRDDKSYPFLAVTLGEEFPRVQVMRGAKRRGTRYFGPYTHVWAIRETVDLLLRVFPVRTCSAGVFRRAGQIGRPCLLGYIGKCSAPCVGRVSAEEHRNLALDFCEFMGGRTQRFVRRLEVEMREAAADLDFERAARRRDDLAALSRVLEKSAVVLPDGTDADVFALAEDDLQAAVQVFHVRGGRIRGQRGWVVEKVEAVTTPDLVEHLLQQVYGVAGEEPGTGEAVPREVLVPVAPPDPVEVEAWLSGLRGSRVEVRVPQRGDKRALLETVARNATQALVLHKTRRAGDLTTRSKALQEIQEALDLDEAPLRIECYDVSHIQGTQTVASMVVFEDGLPRKGEYRRFVLRGTTSGPGGVGDPAGHEAASAAEPGWGRSVAARGPDDVRAIHEVISRRFRRHRQEWTGSADPGDAEAPGAPGAPDGVPPVAGVEPQAVTPSPEPGRDPLTGRPRRFAYRPNLVVVDGGRPQVTAAALAMAELGVEDIAVCGLAKRLEEVWLPDEEYPVILPRSSEGLFLLQRVRDEAHRFAITHHRQRRSRAMTASVLDDIPGLGPVRTRALLDRFGSVARLRGAAVAEVAAVPGIGPRLAESVLAALAGQEAGSAVDTSTGEIID